MDRSLRDLERLQNQDPLRLKLLQRRLGQSVYIQETPRPIKVFNDTRLLVDISKGDYNFELSGEGREEGCGAGGGYQDGKGYGWGTGFEDGYGEGYEDGEGEGYGLGNGCGYKDKEGDGDGSGFGSGTLSGDSSFYYQYRLEEREKHNG